MRLSAGSRRVGGEISPANVRLSNMAVRLKLHAMFGFLRPAGETRPTTSELGAAAGEVRGLGGVVDEGEGGVVRRPGVVGATEAAQQLGTGDVPGVVALEGEPVDGGQADGGAVELGDRDGAVELDDGRGGERRELGVQRGDLGPVGVVGGAGGRSARRSRRPGSGRRRAGSRPGTRARGRGLPRSTVRPTSPGPARSAGRARRRRTAPCAGRPSSASAPAGRPPRARSAAASAAPGTAGSPPRSGRPAPGRRPRSRGSPR